MSLQLPHSNKLNVKVTLSGGVEKVQKQYPVIKKFSILTYLFASVQKFAL